MRSLKVATILVADDNALNRSMLTTLPGYSRNRSYEESALEAGAEAFLQKPVENAEILATIERALPKSERVA
jgi:CheY-like chemotaxis protein